MKKIYFFVFIMFIFPSILFAGQVCDFENFQMGDNENFKSTTEKSFKSGNYTFSYSGNMSEYGFYWNGFSYSTWRDVTTKGYTNQYSAITKFGYDKSDTYCIAYPNQTDTITLDKEEEISGFYITNTTYAYLSMKEGDEFAKRFGGDSGNEPDFFKLIITGYDSDGDKTGEKEFFLADFRFAENSKDYIVSEWEWVDLSDLGKVKQLKFSFKSSDVGDFGMNTPAYFAMDDFNGTPPSDGSSGTISCFISAASENIRGALFIISAFIVIAGILLKREPDEE